MSTDLELNVFYDYIPEEELAFLQLKYDTSEYIVEADPHDLGVIVRYQEPKSWPALFYIEHEGLTRYGLFTSKDRINLSFVGRKNIDNLGRDIR